MIKNMKSKFSLATLAALVFPTLAFAAGKTLADIIDLIIYYLNIILVLFMGAAVVIFVYYVIKYFILPNENIFWFVLSIAVVVVSQEIWIFAKRIKNRD